MRSFLRAHPLLKFLAVHAGLGAVVATLVVAGIILTDVGGIGTLILASADPVVPIVMLVFGFVITMASVAAGAAVMSRGTRGGGGRRRSVGPLVAQPAPSVARRPGL